MEVRIHSCANRASRKTLREATKLFLRELIPPHIFQELRVSIFINPWMKKDLGACTPLRHSKKSKPKSFDIEIHTHKWNTKRLLKTLGHECVHVKQYATGELRDIEIGVTRWKSRKINDTKLAYHKHPWEIEAAGNEENLWVIWKQRKKLDVH